MSSRAGWFGLAAAVAALDRISKAVVQAYVSPWETVPVIPGFFNVIHTQNRGAAFGILSEQPAGWRIALLVGVSGAVTAAVAWLLWRATNAQAAESRLTRTALSLVLGGALGNLYDRVGSGVVTDFLDFYAGSHHWHTFNLADSAITTGALLLAFDLWFSHHREAKA